MYMRQNPNSENVYVHIPHPLVCTGIQLNNFIRKSVIVATYSLVFSPPIIHAFSNWHDVMV